MNKKWLIWMGVTLIVLVGIFFIYNKIIGDKYKYETDVVKVMTANYCSALPGDPPLRISIIQENDSMFDYIKNKCASVPACEWHALVDKISGKTEGYSCCPKDLFIVPRQTEYPDSVLGRCLVE